MATKILIIDDERDLLDTLKEELTNKGYNITACERGKDGIDASKIDKYNVIIVDIKLPDINGVEVIKSIEKIDEKVKFLIITGYAITGEVSDLIESSKRVHGYIFKPFKLEHLEEKIQEILSLP